MAIDIEHCQKVLDAMVVFAHNLPAREDHMDRLGRMIGITLREMIAEAPPAERDNMIRWTFDYARFNLGRPGSHPAWGKLLEAYLDEFGKK